MFLSLAETFQLSEWNKYTFRSLLWPAKSRFSETSFLVKTQEEFVLVNFDSRCHLLSLNIVCAV